MANIILQAGGGAGGVSPWTKVLKDAPFSITSEDLYNENYGYVNKIRPYAFYNSRIQSIDMSDADVSEIGESAFYNCSYLNEIILSSNLNYIGKNAFPSYTQIQNKTEYNSGYYIGNSSNPFMVLLKYDGSDSSVSLQSGVRVIYDNAFASKNNLTSIDLPSSLCEIGTYGFANCSNLTTINGTLSSLHTIQERAFMNDALTAVPQFSASLRYIGESAFAGCLSMAGTLYLSQSSELTIGRNAFGSCYGITSIDLPSITDMDEYAFYGCSGLTTVILNCSSGGYSPYESGKHIFEQCPNINYIKAPATKIKSIIDESGLSSCRVNVTYANSWESDTFKNDTHIDSVVASEDYIREIPSGMFEGCTNITSASLGDATSLATIGNRAFYNCTSLTQVDLPNSINLISDNAFYNCPINYNQAYNGNYLGNSSNPYLVLCSLQTPSLTSVTIPDSCKLIMMDVFRNNTDIQSITIGANSNITRFTNNQFSGCSSLTSIVVPNGLTRIGDNAFNGCSSLTRVDYNNGLSNWCQIATLDGLMMVGNIELYIDGTKIEGDLEITDNATHKLSGGAFMNLPITSVIIDSGIKNIGYINGKTFQGCTLLASVTMPSTIQTIKSESFRGCTSLTTIVIPEGVREVHDLVFGECTSLQSITLPVSLTYLGYYAFNGDSALTDIYYNGTMAQWGSINKGTDWDYQTGNYTIHCSDGDIPK